MARLQDTFWGGEEPIAAAHAGSASGTHSDAVGPAWLRCVRAYYDVLRQITVTGDHARYAPKAALICQDS